MTTLVQLPIKFECKHCHHIYLYRHNSLSLHNPLCPDCQHTGLLMGVAEKVDLLRYPVMLLNKFMKQSWHKLNKVHS